MYEDVCHATWILPSAMEFVVQRPYVSVLHLFQIASINHRVESTRLTSANPGRSFCISSWILCQRFMGSIVTCFNRCPQTFFRLQLGQLSAIQLVLIPEYQGEVSLCHIASGFLLQAPDVCIN